MDKEAKAEKGARVESKRTIVYERTIGVERVSKVRSKGILYIIAQGLGGYYGGSKVRVNKYS